MRRIILYELYNRPFSYSKKESESNDILIHFVGFSNVQNRDKCPYEESSFNVDFETGNLRQSANNKT